MKNILIIEDDTGIHSLLEELLIKEDYKVYNAYSGTEALLILEKECIDLILLDLMLPGMSGEEIIKRKNNIPIIVVSSKNLLSDKVDALLNGANDYITKPFDNSELLARIKVQLRNNNINNSLSYKELKLLDNNILLVNNNKVKLTKTEYLILKELLLNKDRVISKSNLLDILSNYNTYIDEDSLRVHISNIRRKIREYTKREYIESVWGIGFKILTDS